MRETKGRHTSSVRKWQLVLVKGRGVVAVEAEVERFEEGVGLVDVLLRSLARDGTLDDDVACQVRNRGLLVHNQEKEYGYRERTLLEELVSEVSVLLASDGGERLGDRPERCRVDVDGLWACLLLQSVDGSWLKRQSGDGHGSRIAEGGVFDGWELRNRKPVLSRGSLLSCEVATQFADHRMYICPNLPKSSSREAGELVRETQRSSSEGSRSDGCSEEAKKRGLCALRELEWSKKAAAELRTSRA